MEPSEFFDLIKKNRKLDTDYKLAKMLGWTPQRVWTYRNRGGHFNDESCQDIARVLDQPVEWVLAENAAGKAKRREVKAAYRRLAKLAKSAAIALTLGLMIGITSLAPSTTQAANSVLCILC